MQVLSALAAQCVATVIACGGYLPLLKKNPACHEHIARTAQPQQKRLQQQITNGCTQQPAYHLLLLG